jgi:hypothetical protein
LCWPALLFRRPRVTQVISAVLAAMCQTPKGGYRCTYKFRFGARIRP